MSGAARKTVDETEAEAFESERNRVAWNLPRAVRPARSKTIPEAPKERRLPRSAADETAKSG